MRRLALFLKAYTCKEDSLSSGKEIKTVSLTFEFGLKSFPISWSNCSIAFTVAILYF